VQHGGVTGHPFVGDGIPWLDLAERERMIMIVTNGCSASDVDSLGAPRVSSTRVFVPASTA
jgi:hypothetical protein